MRSLLITGAIIMITMLYNGTLAQGPGPGGGNAFEEFFPHSFHGPDVFFDRHKEWIEKFQEEFTFPYDSIDQFNPQ